MYKALRAEHCTVSVSVLRAEHCAASGKLAPAQVGVGERQRDDELHGREHGQRRPPQRLHQQEGKPVRREGWLRDTVAQLAHAPVTAPTSQPTVVLLLVVIWL